MRLKSLAVAAAVLLVAGLAAVAAAVYYLDPRSLAASLAASIKTDTGRELSLGDVEITLLPRPMLVLSNLRFGNAAWGSQPWLAQAGRASADIDVPALFSRRLRIKRIELSDASVFLETDPGGNGNWALDLPAAGAPAWLESLQIDGLALQSLAFAYRDGAAGKTTSVQVDTAHIDADRARGAIRLDARGKYAGKDVRVSGTIGSLRALIADALAYPVDLDGKIGEASVAAHGTIDQPRELAGLKLALSMQSPQPIELAKLFGADAPSLGPFRGTARLTGSAVAPALSAIDATLGGGAAPEIRLRGAVSNLREATGIDLRLTASAARWWHFGTAKAGPRLPPFRASARLREAKDGYNVEDLELKIADSSVNASLQVLRGGPRPRIKGMANAPLIDLANLAPEPDAAAAPAATAGTPRAADRWKFADVDLDLKVGRLVFPGGRELQSGSARLTLDDGRLNASGLQATLGGAKVKLDGSVADPQNLAGLEFDVALQGGELAELFKFFGTAIRPVGAYAGRARMQGSLDALRLSALELQAGRSGQSVHLSGQIEDVISMRGLSLAMTASVSESAAAGNLFGIDLPRLPVLRATARVADAPGGYAFEDLKLVLGRTSFQGRVTHARGEARPRITAELSGPVVDLSELPRPQRKPGQNNPLLVADVDANIRFDRVVLPNRRALGPVSGGVRLTGGAVELKNFSVAVDGASATIEGRIGDPMTPAGVDLMVNAKVTRPAGLEALSGRRMPAIPAFAATGRLTDVPDGYALADLKIAHAATTITGDLAITRGAKRLKVSAKGSSPLLDALALVQPAGKAKAAKPKASGARAIPDVPLPLNILRLIDADLELHFDAVKFGDAVPLGALSLRAALADGRLKADSVQLAGAESRALNLSGTVDAAQGAWSLRADGKGIDFGDLLVRFGHPGVVTGGSTDVNIQLQGRGKSLAAVLGSLDGDARVAIGPYRIHNFAVNLHSGLLARLFSLANPLEKADPDTDVKCLAMRVPVAKGVITSERGVAVETAGYNLVLNGMLNLRTEAIDAAVVPVVGGKVRSVVRLSGTLAAPELGLDAASVARSAAGFGAGLATMGAWWLADAVLNRAASDPHPCATALAAAVPSR